MASNSDIYFSITLNLYISILCILDKIFIFFSVVSCAKKKKNRGNYKLSIEILWYVRIWVKVIFLFSNNRRISQLKTENISSRVNKMKEGMGGRKKYIFHPFMHLKIFSFLSVFFILSLARLQHKTRTIFPDSLGGKKWKKNEGVEKWKRKRKMEKRNRSFCFARSKVLWTLTLYVVICKVTEEN